MANEWGVLAERPGVAVKTARPAHEAEIKVLNEVIVDAVFQGISQRASGGGAGTGWASAAKTASAGTSRNKRRADDLIELRREQ
jgi:hypothetical protein